VDLQGKAAIVTGAGADGSGRAICRRLARAGALVVASDIDEAGGAETVRQIQDDGGRAMFCSCDVRKEEQVQALIRFAERHFGPLGVMVNNASGPDIRPDEPLEHWAINFPTDVHGTMYGTRLAIDALRRASGGAVVNMTSITGLWHGRKNPATGYDLAKAAIIHLSSALGWLGEENIRVNCLAPGWIATAHVRRYWEALSPDQRRERGAPSRLLLLPEVAEAVFLLATDDSLAGRVMVWWSEDAPGLIPWGDRGYVSLEPVTLPNVTRSA